MSAEASPWWHRFFDGENQLRWSSLSKGEGAWAAHVLPWIDIIQSDNQDLPIVLPRLDPDGKTSWYIAGRSLRGALKARESLQAFIGPSYSNFDGRPYHLNEDDAVEVAFAEAAVSPVYRIQASSENNVPKIQRALELFRGLLVRAPKASSQAPRPLGMLRVQLDQAVLIGDEDHANRLLERIRSLGRLDAENLLYLRIGVLAGLGYWREIAKDGELLNQLTGLHLPARVLTDVHNALYRYHIEPSEDVDNPEKALDAFKSSGLLRRSSLFSMRRGICAPRVLKAFFLYELAREDRAQPSIADLARALEESDDTFAHALLDLNPAEEQQISTDIMAEAEAYYENFEFERAFDLYLQAPPSKRRLSRLISCAKEMDTQEAAKSVLDAIKPGDDAGRLPASLEQSLEKLRARCNVSEPLSSPRGWIEWAEQVARGMEIDQALIILREFVVTWDPAELHNNRGHADELMEIINNASDSADEVFREAAPLLCETLISDNKTLPRHLKPLLRLLVTKVALLEDPSQTELELARDLVATLLNTGLDKTEYKTLLDDIQDLMSAQMSVVTVNWALDISELLAIYSCPDSEQRLRLVVRVIDEAKRIAHRLKSTDGMVIEQLCNDYQVDLPQEFLERDDAVMAEAEDALAGKKIGIYTLEEPAAQRAAAVLKSRCSTLSVEINHDHECTACLKNLARSADIFVFAWKSSKHQAFYCVKDHRSSTNPMIQAQGKGTSSILRAVLGLT